MVDPFENVFGNTGELRVVQFLLPLGDYNADMDDIAVGSDVPRPELDVIVRKLLNWHVLKTVGKDHYALDKESGFVAVFEDLNNRLIEQMLGEETAPRL